MLMIGDFLRPSVVRALLMATVSAPALLLAPPALAQTQLGATRNPAQPGTAQDQTQSGTTQNLGVENPNEPTDTGADIIVTAQFREQRLQDTPLAITAINAELLEARSQTNIAQIAQQAPNVTLVPGGAVFGASLGASIRGIGQFDFNPAYEPGVGIYVDDVYFPTLTGSVFDLLDLDRVEVLRGPQGTLTGRNSIGGAIKLFSR
jgi:iron complex outermembrane receptor protein